MNICDLHCDTLIYKQPLLKNRLSVDFCRMGRYEHYMQFFAVCLDPEEREAERALEYAKFFRGELAKNGLPLCKSFQDLEACWKDGKPALFLSLEGGGVIGCMSDLERLFAAGFRMFSLTWNKKNQLAGGADDPDAGLTDFGGIIAEKIEAMGGAVDLSHLNDRSFWEAADVLKKPLIASHSNARAVCPHRRNLTDEQFLRIKKSGGCVGLNLCPHFLSEQPPVRFSALSAHVAHFLSLGGAEQIGLGCDFDGTDSLPEDCRGIEELGRISQILESDPGTTEKITHKNVLRLLKICL